MNEREYDRKTEYLWHDQHGEFFVKPYRQYEFPVTVQPADDFGRDRMVKWHDVYGGR